MATLATPPTWDQFYGVGSGNNSCGAHAVASTLVAAGLLPADTALTSVEAIVGTGDTSTQQLVDALHHFGAATAASAASAGPVLAAGRYAIDLVQSDAQGHPVAKGSTDIDHWVTVYANDGGVVRIANSGSGQDESYAAADFASYFAGVVIDSGCSGEAVATETLSQATFDAFLTYIIGLGRPPESLTNLSDRAQRILAIGADASLWEVTGSAEGIATGGICGVIGAIAARLTAVEEHQADVVAELTARPGSAPPAYDPAPVEAEIAEMKKSLATLHANLAAAGAAS